MVEAEAPIAGVSNEISTKPAVDEQGNPLKPCCACPETRKLRDDCVLFNGEENCQTYIEAHRACLTSYGFIV
ncbi:Cytochrome c oxidase copper chaperone [Paramicrosporidium saccamoebae]|uniref:Cytochrome c oxidase copper chaperone n=1 Tax=Paramicrosporidium saccamoebae TaxID=1246581 RepID=A0A2H9TLW7_9FUNG|nr:Cytochrome c oxidase copper chaperone [Paramicrosporidium saccamoebae]